MTKAPVKSPAKTAVKPAVKAAVKPAAKVAKAPKAAPQPIAKPNLTVVPQIVASATAAHDPVNTELSVTETAAKPVVKPTVDDVIKATHVLKLRALVDQVAAATGAKKKGLKEVVEATLAALGAALSRGDELNLPPLGKAKVGRQKAMGEGEMLVVKLRRGGGASHTVKADEKDGEEALAVSEE